MNKEKSDQGTLAAAAIQASKPILVELAQYGVVVDSLADLVNKPIDYKSAVPMLIRWLTQTTNPSVKETIVRALTTKWAKPAAAQSLIDEFNRVPESHEMGLKWTIGNALSVVADDTVLDEIVQLACDEKHGRAREMLAVALGNMKNARAVDVLIDLLNDEQVCGHALIALRKLAPPKAREAIEHFVDHPKTWVRNEARRALTKIDKKEARNQS